jgi:hypothetical protein
MSMRKKKMQEGKAIENAIAGHFVVSWWGMVNWLLILATKVTHRNQKGALLRVLVARRDMQIDGSIQG